MCSRKEVFLMEKRIMTTAGRNKREYKKEKVSEERGQREESYTNKKKGKLV